jgi:hypothetical protein
MMKLSTTQQAERRRNEQAAARAKQKGHARPQASVTHRTETITPEMATAWLERNTTNRHLDQPTVDRYARDMTHGRWHLTGDSVKFGFSGVLIDGQHRLWACVLAGVPFTSIVVRGITNEAEVRDVIDTGKKRTLGNALQIHGEPDANNLAALISMAWRYDNFRLAGPYPTHEEGLAYLDDHPDIRQSVLFGRRMQKAVKASPAACGTAHFLGARIDHEAADTFWAAAATGEGLDAGSPVLAFRHWTIQMASRREKPRPDTTLMYALKAMNLDRAGKKVRLLQVKDIEGVPEVWT